MSNLTYAEYMHGTQVLDKIEYLDLETGETAVEKWDVSIWGLTDGNWSCDCNRGKAFGESSDHKYCLGNKRYIVSNIEAKALTKEQIQDIIDEANQDYEMPNADQIKNYLVKIEKE